MASAGNSRVDCQVSTADIEEAVQAAGLEPLSAEALQKFKTYLKLLLWWNSKLNLTAIRDPAAIIQRHFVEGIQCAQLLPALSSRATLLDFGSGAGFPGIPIAICREDFRVTLAESQGKKAAFLREAVRSLGISVEVYDGRVEHMRPERRFSIVTLRAVDKIEEALLSAVARLVPGGWLVVFTTDAVEGELGSELPWVELRNSVPVAGLAHGRIVMSQRSGEA